MVRWFDPHQLLDTMARVIASGVWTSYAEIRELQGLSEARTQDRSERSELWLDYVSDLGDGWNSTYTVAWLLAQEKLDLGPNGEEHHTRRGQVLVMGGDQVYPVPKRANYENRLVGPYTAAHPCADGEEADLFAIPGSHDWYDGLVNFTNLFCRGRPLGGWRTSQSRSYFAVKLPQQWWLWGLDLQFGDYLDEVQLRYFTAVADEGLKPGDSVVLCIAKGVESGRKSTEVCSDRHITYLEREVVEPAGAHVAVYLRSGRHYYSRYEKDDGSGQLITAGGGGAFMHPTHDLPEREDLHISAGEPRFRRTTTYPSARDSKRLRKRVFLLPAYNLPLAAVFGTVQVMLAFMLNLHRDDRHRDLQLGDLRRALWESPTAFLLILLLILTVGIMVRLAHDAAGLSRLVLGGLHSLTLFATLAVVMMTASTLSSGVAEGPASLLIFLGLVAAIGGIGGVLGIAAYLWLANCFGFHGNEAYAPLHHCDYKNFLRLHIGGDGAMTIYPIGIDRVGRKWELRPDAPATDSWFAPAAGDPRAHLIEDPIRIEARSEGTTARD